MPPLLFSTILAGLLGTGVQGSYLYRYLLVADGQCDHFKRCRGAESLTECKAWSKHVQGSTQNVTVDSSIPSPYGCVLNGDGEEVLYRAKKNATCSASQKCICRCEDNTRYGKGTANRLINVALYADDGATVRAKGNTYVVLNYEEANMRTVNFTASDMAEHLNSDDYDVVFFPGGERSVQEEKLGEAGLGAVKNFVAAGGAYVGVCAGAFLAINALYFAAFVAVPDPDGSLYRGDGNTTLGLTTQGESSLSGVTSAEIEGLDFFYANGPVMNTSDTLPPNVSEPVILSYYNSSSVPIEKGYVGPKSGYGLAAVTMNKCMGSRVVLSGPHPETNEMDMPDRHGPPSTKGSVRGHLLQSYVKLAADG